MVKELIDWSVESLKIKLWELTGKAVINNNDFGDAVSVTIDINTWREITELIHPRKETSNV